MEFAAVFFLLIAGAILVIWLFQTFFLEKYYLSRKHSALSDAYEQLETAAREDGLSSDAFDVVLQRISSGNDIGLIIMDEESKTVKVYASDPEVMTRRMWENMLDRTDQLPEEAAQGRGKESVQPEETGGDNSYIVERTGDRNGQRVQIVLDERTGLQHMEMWGILENGSFYLLRTTVESIRNNSRIAGRFVLYVGILILIAGGIIASLLAGRITEPIRELTEISKRMKKLDFTARYAGNDSNEIGELGENINDLSSELERTISQLKTANQKLLQDIQIKEQNEKSQIEFISNVTHELKTPIALIQGYAEGLMDGVAADEESRRFYSGVILDESSKMNQMVQKLLTLMHLESGTTSITMERFNMSEVIVNYLQSAALLASDQEIEIRVTDSANGSQCLEKQENGSFGTARAIPDYYVWADEYMAEEVLGNYFSNALHYSTKIIDIRLQQKENCLRISVFNTGKTIPEEALPRIWDKFYKEDKARSRTYGGSGVGLSIVRAVMELMERDYGVINYENGVEFWFELELADKG